jgi:hypothetical protein
VFASGQRGKHPLQFLSRAGEAQDHARVNIEDQVGMMLERQNARVRPRSINWHRQGRIGLTPWTCIASIVTSRLLASPAGQHEADGLR